MNTIEPNSFAMICFLILMVNGEGISDKSPYYIGEKILMLSEGYNSFSYLDIYNMRKVIDYCKRWHLHIPDKITEEYHLQENALSELESKGFRL